MSKSKNGIVPPDSTIEYEVEGTHKWTAGDTDDWHYELKDMKDE